MSFSQTAIGFMALFGLGTLAIQTAAPDASHADLPPAIKVNEIVIRSDGSTVYDREIPQGPAWQAWAGVIYDTDGGIHCSGGDLSQYTGPLPDPSAYDADWLVGGDCIDGLEAGMTFYFTWTPMGPDFSVVRFPEEGYGVVMAAD